MSLRSFTLRPLSFFTVPAAVQCWVDAEAGDLDFVFGAGRYSLLGGSSSFVFLCACCIFTPTASRVGR